MVDQDLHRERVIEKVRSLNQNIKEKVMHELQVMAQRGIKLGEQVGVHKGLQRLNS